ncbi:hypothetical protein FRC12_022331, partial [Ceratobasidium sp. 428]
MTFAQFDTLPVDLLLTILSLLPGSSIRQCLQVCRLLNDLIRSSDYLGYLIELDACGYVKPDRVRTDLSYGEMIKLLREQKVRWDNPQSVVPTYYDLPPGHRVGHRPFNKGVFAIPAKRDDRLIHQIHFHRLPSKNKGFDYELWTIGFGVLFRDFLIDPDQDLLVGLELIHTDTTPASKVHLRSMRTSNNHPKSVPGQFILARWIFDEFDAPSMDIIGHSLAIFGRSFLGALHAEIWDWTTGRQLSYLNLNDINAFSVRLLSEDSFVICHSAPFASSAPFLEGALGCLNVYQFGLYQTAPAEAVHVGSFALPPDKNAGLQYRLAPSTSAQSHGCSTAKLYNLESQDRLIYIGISTMNNRTPAMGNLCAPASTLLDALLHPSPQGVNQPPHALIPWADWASKAFWILQDGPCASD